MEYLDITKSLKIKLKKSIGTVLIVVEGAVDEFDLFDMIFRKILHYNLITKSRNKKEFREYNEYVMNDNKNSRVIIINTSNSNIGSIKDDDNYRNELYKILYEKYSIDSKNIPIYFIWDRDNGSNTDKRLIKNLLSKLNDPYENDNYENGLLLLSYPCIESYLVTCLEKNKMYETKHLKDYIAEKSYKVADLNRYKVRDGAIDLIKKLNFLGYKDFTVDDIKNINKDVFEKEEELYKKNNQYLILSFVSYILLDLGIIS